MQPAASRVRSEVFTAVTVKSTIFWDVTPCILVEVSLTLLLD
jgi:hypothetical protein